MDTIHDQERRQFNRLFKAEGVDRVADRLAVLEVFLRIERHISFQELMDALHDSGYSFEPDFVKKTLNLLCRYGFAVKKEFEGRPPLYEHRHIGFHHDHLICTKCGKIVEFENSQMEGLQVEIAALHGFHVLQHKMEMYGLCSECLKERVRLMPLAAAQEGERGIVEEFMGRSGAQLRLATLGLKKGDQVEVITNSGQGQLIVAANATRLAMGRGIAKKILVRPNGRRRDLP
ncbi:MAG: transcriptional repressor [Deltaproteobacteria bacterium]|nr:transcriptional repressor [Deltaproteobacteria bacterium]